VGVLRVASDNSFRKNSGGAEMRTRDLCRDRYQPQVTVCNFGAPIASFGALRNPVEPLLHPTLRRGLSRFRKEIVQNCTDNLFCAI
jgi:hypothetical protein